MVIDNCYRSVMSDTYVRVNEPASSCTDHQGRQRHKLHDVLRYNLVSFVSLPALARSLMVVFAVSHSAQVLLTVCSRKCLTANQVTCVAAAWVGWLSLQPPSCCQCWSAVGETLWEWVERYELGCNQVPTGRCWCPAGQTNLSNSCSWSIALLIVKSCWQTLTGCASRSRLATSANAQAKNVMHMFHECVLLQRVDRRRMTCMQELDMSFFKEMDIQFSGCWTCRGLQLPRRQHMQLLPTTA